MAILDVVVGIFFMFLLLAMLVSVIQESLASILKWRAQNLYRAIENLLRDEQDKGLVVDLYRHPIIKSLYRKPPSKSSGEKPPQDAANRDPEVFLATHGRRLPSYIPSRSFALALVDVLRRRTSLSAGVGADTVLAEAKDAVKELPDGELKRALLLLVSDAQNAGQEVSAKAAAASARLEGWFNASMVRAAGWYKREAQWVSFLVSAGVALVANADTLHVGGQLWRDANLRASVAAAAAGFHAGQEEPPGGQALGDVVGEIADAQLPIGWYATEQGFPLCPRPAQDGTCEMGWRGFVALLLGWLVTAFAISLGAAFWFNVLGKALQLRASGGKILAETGEVEAASTPSSK